MPARDTLPTRGPLRRLGPLFLQNAGPDRCKHHEKREKRKRDAHGGAEMESGPCLEKDISLHQAVYQEETSKNSVMKFRSILGDGDVSREASAAIAHPFIN